MRRWVPVIIVVVMASWPISAFFTSVTDDFERSGANLGGNWVESESNGIGTDGHNATPAASPTNNPQYAYYNGGGSTSWANDQSSSITLNTNSATYFAATVRFTGTTFSNMTGYYCFLSYDGSYFLGKFASSADTDLKTGSGTAVGIGDVVKCSVTGTTISYLLNGTTIDSFIDSSYASGSPGIGFANGTGNRPLISTWTGDPTSGGGGGSFVPGIPNNPLRGCCHLWGWR